MIPDSRIPRISLLSLLLAWPLLTSSVGTGVRFLLVLPEGPEPRTGRILWHVDKRSHSGSGAEGDAPRLLLDVRGPLPDLPGPGPGQDQFRAITTTSSGSRLK
jgi:hypothetical protein